MRTPAAVNSNGSKLLLSPSRYRDPNILVTAASTAAHAGLAGWRKSKWSASARFAPSHDRPPPWPALDSRAWPAWCVRQREGGVVYGVALRTDDVLQKDAERQQPRGDASRKWSGTDSGAPPIRRERIGHHRIDAHRSPSNQSRADRETRRAGPACRLERRRPDERIPAGEDGDDPPATPRSSHQMSGR